MRKDVESIFHYSILAVILQPSPQQRGSREKETRPQRRWSLFAKVICSCLFLLLLNGRSLLGILRFLRLLRWGVLFDLFELFLLLLFPLLCQFLLTLFVLIIYLSQFSVLSSYRLDQLVNYSISSDIDTSSNNEKTIKVPDGPLLLNALQGFKNRFNS